MRKITFLAILLFNALLVLAQDSVQMMNRVNLFLEVGGAGYFLSANGEYLLPVGNSLNLSGRAGLGIYPSLDLFEGKASYSPVIPITVSLNYGKAFALEAGLGASIGFSENWLNGILGLRYQSPASGFLIRLGYTPYWEKMVGISNFYGLSMGTRINTGRRK